MHVGKTLHIQLKSVTLQLYLRRQENYIWIILIEDSSLPSQLLIVTIF